MVELEKELIILREENARLKSGSEGDKRRIKDLEGRLVNAESANTSLQRKVTAFNNAKITLENELDEKELLLNQQKRDQKKTAKKFRQHMAVQEQVNSELAVRLKEQQEKTEAVETEKVKMQAVRSIVNGTPARKASDPAVPVYSSARKVLAPVKSNPDISISETPRPRRKSAAISNPRHRRSKSAGDLWVDHQPATPVPMNTVMQPKIEKRKSVTKITDKDILDDKVSKYCLTTQSQDTDGELETKLYKGDVIPTATGGRQVVFDDVEVLRQESPTREPSPMRTRRSKRSYEEFSGVSNRIAALEDKLNAVAGSKAGSSVTPGDVGSGYHRSKKYRV